MLPLRLIALLVPLVAVLLGPTTPARAHAVLLEAVPIDGAVLQQAPSVLRLRFNEPVAVPSRGIRLFDRDGEQVALGDDGDPEAEAVVLAVGEPLGDGPYILTWRVLSADGHVVRGALQFSVRVAEVVEEEVAAALFSDASADRWGTAGRVARALGFAATLLAAGAALFLALVWRRVAPPGAQDAMAVRLRRAGAAAATVGVAATGALVAVQAGALAERGIAGIVDASALAEALRGPFGVGMGLRVAGLVVIAALLAARPPRALPAAVAAALVVVSFPFVGHSAVSSPHLLAWTADAAHAGAAAVWFGGLVCVGLVLARARRDVGVARAAAVLSAWSRLAAFALAAVAASGAALAWLEVRGLSALTTAPYGRVLVVKLALVAVVVVIAALNRFRLVPRVAEAGDGEHAWRGLRRAVTAEAGVMAVVLAVTAVLVALQPAREAAGIGGTFTADIALERHAVQVVVDPNRAGMNAVHLYLVDRVGRPVAAEDLLLRLSMPETEIGPLERRPLAAGPGHWVHAGPELQSPGRWRLEVVVVHSRFERETAAVDFTVNP